MVKARLRFHSQNAPARMHAEEQRVGDSHARPAAVPLVRHLGAVVTPVDGDPVHPELRQEVRREVTEEDAPEADLATHLLRQVGLDGVDLELVGRPTHPLAPSPAQAIPQGRADDDDGDQPQRPDEPVQQALVEHRHGDVADRGGDVPEPLFLAGEPPRTAEVEVCLAWLRFRHGGRQYHRDVPEHRAA